MDKNHEIQKITSQILLPISDIKFNSDHSQVELFYNNQSIGFLRSIPIPTNGPTIIKYQTDKDSISQLNWRVIFEKNRGVITELTRKLLKEDKLELVPYAHDRFNAVVDGAKDHPLMYGYAFENGQWRVYETMK